MEVIRLSPHPRISAAPEYHAVERSTPMDTQKKTNLRFGLISGTNLGPLSFVWEQDLNEKTKKLVEENPKVQKAVQRITDAAIKYAEAIQKRDNLQHEFLEVKNQESFFKRKVHCVYILL